MDARTKTLIDRLERTLGELRGHLGDERTGSLADDASGFDAIDWARRQRPEWEPRGRLMNALAEEGGNTSFERWKELGASCGYKTARGLNGFFAGDPPVVTRDGDDVVLTPRGEAGAAYWRRRYGGENA